MLLHLFPLHTCFGCSLPESQLRLERAIISSLHIVVKSPAAFIIIIMPLLVSRSCFTAFACAVTSGAAWQAATYNLDLSFLAVTHSPTLKTSQRRFLLSLMSGGPKDTKVVSSICKYTALPLEWQIAPGVMALQAFLHFALPRRCAACAH